MESSDASPGRPLQEDPWDQNGMAHANFHSIDVQHLHDNQEAHALLQDAVDLTRRSDFLAVDKKLAQYFKNASAMTWPLFLALLSSTFCDGKRGHILKIFRVSSAISLALNLLPLFLAGRMAEEENPLSENEDEDHDNERVEPLDRYRIHVLSVAAYLSNGLLTVTAISFAMVFRAGYDAWFFCIVVGLLLAYCFIIWQGVKHGIAWGLAQYAEHRSDIDFFFGLCFEITQTNFTALSATLFGYLKTGQGMDVEFRAPEIILLVAVVIGLFVIIMCTAPPALGLPRYRRTLVRTVMRFTVYGLLFLTSLGLFWAVISISGSYLWFSIAIPLVDVVLYFFFRDIQLRREQPAPARAADEQSFELFSFHSVMSGALMAWYSLDIRDQNTGFRASMAIMYSAILAYLGMVIITREANNGKSIAVWLSSLIAAALLIAALVCVTVLVLSNPFKIGSSYAWQVRIQIRNDDQYVSI